MAYHLRHHNHPMASVQNEGEKKPFFSRQHDLHHANQNNTFFQAKLTVNTPGDKYEQEADQVANAVINNKTTKLLLEPNKNSRLQRVSAEPEKEKLKKIQKKEASSEEEKKKKEAIPVLTKPDKAGATTTPLVTARIRKAAGKGKPLPSKTLQIMNAAFGVDFSAVRIHTNREAGALNKALQAQAFTHGRDIYFQEGNYNPENAEGKFLLAHELMHVVQQGAVSESGLGDTVQKSPAAAIAIGAAATAAILCAYGFFQYALDHFPEKSDKWKHCWVSCKIAAWCGGSAFSLIIGAGKEGIDAICDAYGQGCKAEFLDFVADLEGIACANIPLLSCTTCCDESAAYL